MLRLGALAIAVSTSVAAAVACSSSGGGDDQNGAPDASDDGQTLDVVTPDAASDQSAPSDAGMGADSGPSCKTSSCAIAIGAGPSHTCVVLGDHTVKCWGDNAYGELGTGAVSGTKVTPAIVTTPTLVAGISDAIGVRGGGQAGATGFSCALRAGGAVRCWGNNTGGELGDVTDASVSPGGATVAADASAADIRLGERHACMMDTAGALRCWGDNSYNDRGSPALSPIALPTDAGLASIAAGAYATCATTTTGTLLCFGNNSGGQVDPTSAAGSAPATVIDAGGSVESVSPGLYFMCATLAGDGGVSCWGTNTAYQLGRAGAVSAARPASPAFSGGLAPIAAYAGGQHACAIMADRGVDCWGYNGRGQAGDFSGRVYVTAPSGVGGVANAVDLALGANHSCALTAAGDVYCWGANDRGQLGPSVGDGGVDQGAHADPVKIPL